MIQGRQVIVLGVDGLDAGLLESLGHSLPSLRSLARVSYRPIFPPDSVPAWSSIQTGLPIEAHRLLTSKDYLRLSNASPGALASPLRDRTFYDRVSRAGGKVIVVNPFLGYPTWPLDGLMVSGPAFSTGPVETWPREAASEWNLLPIGGLTGEPSYWNRSSFLQSAIAEIPALAEPFLRELGRREWDCAFLTLLSLDRIKHFFWRFCDPLDPDYPGPTPYRTAVEDGYGAVDHVVGSLLEAFPQAAVLVVSDHGHARRPKQLFELGEWLRRRGLLAAASPRSFTAVVERTKRSVVTGLSRLRMEDMTRLLAKVVPRAAELKDSSFAVSSGESLVEVCPFGRNAFGGLRVNIEDEDGRRKLLDELVVELQAVRSPAGEPVIRSTRVVQRADALRASGLPDLEIELYPAFAVGRDLYGKLFSASPYRRRISGGHSTSAVMAYGGPIRRVEENAERAVVSVDLAASVLGLLGIEYEGDLTGRPFVEWLRAPSA
jgi:predicted AlkP superfamily phosphohydrolase/phosphomutase